MTVSIRDLIMKKIIYGLILFLQFLLGLNVCQQLDKDSNDLSPEMNFPLLSTATVVLGENSVKYRHSNTISPVQIPAETFLEHSSDQNQTNCVKNSVRPCSIPVYPTNKSQSSPTIVHHPNSYDCLYGSNENLC